MARRLERVPQVRDNDEGNFGVVTSSSYIAEGTGGLGVGLKQYAGLVNEHVFMIVASDMDLQ